MPPWIHYPSHTYHLPLTERMCSVAGEMLAAYSPPSYYFPCRLGSRALKLEAARPCLVLAHPEESRAKKRVVFADDRGLSLTQVRTMSEPSCSPPSWSAQFIRALTKEREEGTGWETTFPQPASDYIQFKRRLDQENLSLENVFIKESEEVAVGTVKVRNLSFEKEVILRVSHDSWKTHQDIPCTYVNNSLASSSVTVLYDTFSFRIPLRSEARTVEFCACYKCDGMEYWDNNNTNNYILVHKSVDKVSRSPKSEPVSIPRKTSRPLEPWSGYSNWVDTPYW